MGAGNSDVVFDLPLCGPMLLVLVYRISYRFLVPGWSAKPLVSAHDRIMGTHRVTPEEQVYGLVMDRS